MTEVDLQQLVIDRGDTARSILHTGRHLLTRYMLPAALFAGFDLLPGAPFTATLLEAVICYVIVVLADIAWVLIGATLRRHLHDPRKSRIINVSFAVLLVLSVIPALTVLR